MIKLTVVTLVLLAIFLLVPQHHLEKEPPAGPQVNDNPATLVGLNDTVFYQVKKALLPTINKYIAYNKWVDPADHVKKVELWMNPFTINDIQVVFDQANQLIHINVEKIDGKISAEVELKPIKTTVTADMNTNLKMNVKLFEQGGIPQVSVPYGDLPINKHTLHFHGTITEAIMKIVLDVFSNKIEKDIDKKALETQVPAAINKQLKSMNTKYEITPNISVDFFTTSNPQIMNHEIHFPVGAYLINRGKKSLIQCEPIKFSSTDMWQDPLQAYVGDCVFSAVMIALADMGKLNYTFPVIQHLTPDIVTLYMSMGIAEMPTLTMMNNFEVSGGKELFHWNGFDQQLGHFQADINATLKIELSAFIKGYEVIFESANITVSNIAAKFYGCLNDDKCKQIEKKFTAKVINDILFIIESVINTYFKGHPFKLPTMDIGHLFVVESPFLQFKEHFMEIGINIRAK